MANPLQPIAQPLSEPPPDSGFEADSKVPAGLVVLFLILKLLLVVGIIFLGCMLCLLMRFCWFCVFGKEVAGKAMAQLVAAASAVGEQRRRRPGAAAGGGAPVTPAPWAAATRQCACSARSPTG